MQGLETSWGIDGQSRPQAFERRVCWLEEDVTVLQRRLQDECNEGNAIGHDSLHGLVVRLDSELSAEKLSRDAMEARMTHIEDSIRHERKEREVQLRGFSKELESTMRGLISHIDASLSAGAAAMRERTDATESRLRILIKRVDEGLSVGAAALQDTLTATNGLNLADREPLRATLQNTTQSGEDEQIMLDEAIADHLRHSRDAPRQAPTRAEQRQSPNGYANDMISSKVGTPSTTPASVIPQTMQVRGSGLSNNQYSGGMGNVSRIVGSGVAPPAVQRERPTFGAPFQLRPLATASAGIDRK